jgi:hypothetical protein
MKLYKFKSFSETFFSKKVQGQLSSLPIYRDFRLNRYALSFIATFEIGLVHGFFFVGPFISCNQFRNSEINYLISCFSTASFLFLVALWTKMYFKIISQNVRSSKVLKMSYMYTSNYINPEFSKSIFLRLTDGLVLGGLLGTLIASGINYFIV